MPCSIARGVATQNFHAGLYLSPNQEIHPKSPAGVVDWKDFGSLFCPALILLGVAALVTASQNFAILRGRVLTTGVAVLDGQDGSVQTRTVTLVIENSDRVFHIERGTTVEYAISDEDALLVQSGSEVELMVSTHQAKARILKVIG